MSKVVAGKVAVVTGAGRGIGRGEALLLAREGARVVVNDVDAPDAQAVAGEIERAGGEAVAHVGDVSATAGAESLVALALDTWGRLDLVVNNAGILRDRMVYNLSEHEWDAVIKVHLRGHFLVTRSACRYWRERAKAGEEVSGRIVNTSSTSGLLGNVGQSNYGAAKAGIAAFTQIVAIEMARFGVTANAIAPGARTRMTENVYGEHAAPADGFDPLHPDNVAPLVVYLASDAAAHITGQVFRVHGGHIEVYEGWRPVAAIDKDGRWDPAELAERVDALFEGRATRYSASAIHDPKPPTREDCRVHRAPPDEAEAVRPPRKEMAVKIDAFCHIMPRAYYDRFVKLHVNERTEDLHARVSTLRMLIDLDERFRQMDEFGDYRQLIAMAAPPVWDFGSPEVSREMARIANEGMAELVRDYPDRFVGFTASVPMDDPDAAVEEYQHARIELGSLGAQIYTDVHGRPMDLPEFDPFYETVAASGGLLQVHPSRSSLWPDYPMETRSRYEIWWAFGWEYDLSAFMARIVFSGVLERYPALKLLIHHAGSMVPHFAGRVGPGWDQLGMRTPDDRKDEVRGYPLTKRPVEYFKMMYVDTALFGAPHAVRCAIDFYGVDHILFGSDSPYGPPTHGGYLKSTIESIDALDLSEAERDAIFYGNVTELLGLVVPA